MNSTGLYNHLKSNKYIAEKEFNRSAPHQSAILYIKMSNSLSPVVSKTVVPVSKNTYKGRSLAVFTSGGDAQGMNAALRAITRMGIYLGCNVYFIHEGYEGMVDGSDDLFHMASWNDVTRIIGLGGTLIGSARSKAFRERSGRLRAAKNLIKRNITHLVCIGGDGSLTGAYTFRQEWPSYVQELQQKGEIDADHAERCAHLQIVGLVGSIDNDFCGTDMTIGADTALHRIFEAVDAISTTGSSHQRCFVLEVMGRRCGYLGLMTAIGSEADWIFIPEYPANDGWEQRMCSKLAMSREAGQRLNIIIVAEGAIDTHGTPISSEQVKNVIVDRLKYDTRVTVLGHVQRGGTTSAFDRVLGTRMGAEAVIALMESQPNSEPVVISLAGNKAVRVELTSCVEKTIQAGKALDEHNYKLAIALRGRTFAANLDMYIQLATLAPKRKDMPSKVFNVAVLNVGAPACGMNAAVRAVVRYLIAIGHKAFIVYDGFGGLAEGRVIEGHWRTVMNFVGQGGSALGTQKRSAGDVGLERIANSLKKWDINGVIIIGGFEGFSSIMQMYDSRDRFEEFRIPLILVPATISNNIPGTDFTLGSDTALNEIISMVDKTKQSASGSKRRVFIVEAMGGYCGYLATISALACGADQAYIFENPFHINDIVIDAEHLKKKMTGTVKRGIILRSENCSSNFTTDFLTRLYADYGKGVFSTRSNILGHQQQGGNPSPFDRSFATKIGTKAVNYCLKCLEECWTAQGKVETNEANTAVVIGLTSRSIQCTPIDDLRDDADFEHRIPKQQWWLKLKPLLRILSSHESNYIPELDMTGSQGV